MRQTIFTVLFVYLSFIVEFSIYNYVHPWLMPNFILLTIIFTNLAFGIRYSLLAAFWGGCLRDSFVAGTFGMHMVSFVICAYLTTLLMKNFYQKGSSSSRLLLVAMVTMAYVIVTFIMNSILGSVQPGGTVQFVLLPELVTTLIMANPTFQLLRKCALKFFA